MLSNILDEYPSKGEEEEELIVWEGVGKGKGGVGEEGGE